MKLMELGKYSVALWFKLLLMTVRLESKVRKMKKIPPVGMARRGEQKSMHLAESKSKDQLKYSSMRK